MESSTGPNKALIGIIVVALIAVIATAVIVMSANNSANDTSNETASISPSASPSSSTESTTNSSSELKDGTYSATGSYQTPGGQESIGVTVTLTGGTITDASVTQQGKTGEAEEYQAKFASGFKSQVVGKKIDEVSLTRVAGSSLTPNGFNNAIDDIENQAKA